MKTALTLVAYGSLAADLGRPAGAEVRVPLEAPRPLACVLEALGIPAVRVQLAMVNHRAARLEAPVAAGDRAALFPPETPIFADWHGFRSV
jgi:hypothetical protein